MVRTTGTRRRWLGRLAGVGGGLTAILILAGTTLALDQPPNWHVHDGQSGAGHRPVVFFPAILDQTLAQYLADPARCPNATDKASLPSADERASDVHLAGVCMTSTAVIQLRGVPTGTDGPAGWSSLPMSGWVLYYRITPR